MIVSVVAIAVEESADFGECEGDEAPVNWCWVVGLFVGCGRVVGLFVVRFQLPAGFGPLFWRGGR